MRLNPHGTLRTYLKQIVYGGNDGIITTFAIVAGFAGAQAHGAAAIGALAVLVFGMANLTADAVSMGMGEFLSGRSNRDLYRARHVEAQQTAAADPETAADRLAGHLAAQGLAPEAARHTADHLATSPTLMADLMLRYDHGMEAPDAHNLGVRAWMTFAAFVLFGAIPLLPYIIAPAAGAVFATSLAATALALALLGVLRWLATRESLTRCVAETLALGGLCAGVAFGAGRLVAGLG
ncbi:VIT1/CCC1 transporter family protein [Maritimibacter sp. HL-12]|uniref:VIT1/CCC1 transporter family protein n=1 Tax=Maritimibacter sp. HL-12 TaxID=1162418 RepID=UPI000A0F2E77|nr:VIT1/CCC1 transporter family protein [Maritimibacter sp. HL-12]SMH56708.1 Predicted Fe2+/Mn2+ transporter, VIT1/CCC1 family [Maritimibacter sp. HL-12]